MSFYDVDYSNASDGQVTPGIYEVFTVPLMTGAFAGRLNLKGYILLVIFWNLFIYFPVCHWIWGGGFLSQLGFRDFAGGTVIHTTAGFGSLACIITLGQRNIPITERNKHSSIMAAAIGTGLLWFGWFGFNSGGALRADYQAVNAFGATFIALALAMITWIVVTRIKGKKFDFVDILTGSVAGLATITPCAGYVTPTSAIMIGIIAGIVCHSAVDYRKKKQWDDALDVWGVHGIGGFTGTILIGIFATNSHLLTDVSSWYLLGIQILGVIIVAIYAYVITTGILKTAMYFTDIATTKEEQEEGLDFTFFQENKK
ncbi:ammonium transporter [Enterococcus faecalis 13-SD-W-01]|nr:ammonium transporter [Enterococcus faecalis 13-SD-W-01]